MKYLMFALLLISTTALFAQDPLRFKDEVEQLKKKEYSYTAADEVTVFTGSSSVRMWKDVQSYFPEEKIINTGFGGSQMVDLLYYLDDLVLQYQPDRIFIYEGDNDLAAKKKPADILKVTKQVVNKIEEKLGDEVEIILISAKPSIARKELKEEYIKLNKKLEKYSRKKENVQFTNVWKVMFDGNGNLMEDLFIEDGLHMNKKGYDLWAGEIGKYFN